jgi:hypothetical protein
MGQQSIFLKIDLCTLMRLHCEDLWMARTTGLSLINNALRYLAFSSEPHRTTITIPGSSRDATVSCVVSYEHRCSKWAVIRRTNVPARNAGSRAWIQCVCSDQSYSRRSDTYVFRPLICHAREIS